MESEKGKEILAELGSDKRALVPGCGKGYDVAYLAENGFQAWGMDLSPTAVEEAQKFWASADESVKAKMSFRQGDYFNFEIPEGRFDVMYDYTFFCAFPPSMREAYGKRVREIVRIGGYFVGLVYPIDGGRTGGPPYSVSVEALSESIHGASEWTKVVEFVPKVSTESHVNRERFVVWKRIA
ncbi:hypothetical protein FRB99_006187 [Tulasnella sp. 403]|nr:hypothetical protein FRB99_006187 [Tulasnella sp. 403]